MIYRNLIQVNNQNEENKQTTKGLACIQAQTQLATQLDSTEKEKAQRYKYK
jgi:hypothetical protein